MESSAVTAGAVSAVAATRAQLSSATADSVLARVDHSAICATFLAFDSGAKGALTRHELRCAHLSLLGYAPSRLELDVLLPKGGQLELAAFCEAMAARLVNQEPDDAIRRAFRAFDADHKGFVGRRDLQRVLDAVAPHLPPRTAALAFDMVDSDGDGRVSYRDFHGMMSARPSGATPSLVRGEFAGPSTRYEGLAH